MKLENTVLKVRCNTSLGTSLFTSRRFRLPCLKPPPRIESIATTPEEWVPRLGLWMGSPTASLLSEYLEKLNGGKYLNLPESSVKRNLDCSMLTPRSFLSSISR